MEGSLTWRAWFSVVIPTPLKMTHPPGSKTPPDQAPLSLLPTSLLMSTRYPQHWPPGFPTWGPSHTPLPCLPSMSTYLTLQCATTSSDQLSECYIFRNFVRQLLISSSISFILKMTVINAQNFQIILLHLAITELLRLFMSTVPTWWIFPPSWGQLFPMPCLVTSRW